MNKILKKANLIFSIILFLAAGSITATAQDKHDRDKNQGGQNIRTRNTRPQQHQAINRSQVNHPQVNHPQVNQAPVNRPQVNQTPIVNRTPNRRPGGQTVVNNPGYRPRGWAPTRRAYKRPPVIYGGKRFYTYHKYYPHPFTTFSYGPRWHPIGFFISALVSTAIIIDLENRSYRYSDGVFYTPYNNGYQVVPAPPGAYVPSIPEGYQQVQVGGENYYYFGGAFFVLNGNNYEVVQAPAGAVVYNLPQGATTVQVDNYNYVQYNGTYYQPIQINGQDAYEVVELEPDTQQ